MNKPADTLAPCPFCGADPLIGAWEAAPSGWPDATAIQCSNSVSDCRVNPAVCEYERDTAIAAWNRRASLKGEAEPVAWMYEMDCGSLAAVKSKLDVPQGKTARPLIYGDTASPAPQAAGEDHERDEVLALLAELARALPPISVEQPAIQHMIQRNRREQALQRIGDFILHKAANPTPSPAPHGGGEAKVETLTDLYWHITRNALKDGSPFATACMDALPALNAAAVATPPAQQPGEVGERSPYGYCPICSAPGKVRERRPGGSDICDNQHTYPSRDSIHVPTAVGQDLIERAARALCYRDHIDNSPNWWANADTRKEYLAVARTALTAALAPKEKGNG